MTWKAVFENPMTFDLKSAFQPAGFAPGDKVYWDSMSGLVPAVVLEDFPARKEVRIRLTGTRGPWRRGEGQVLSHRDVVFRDQVRTTKMGQYRIGPRRLR